MEIDLSDRGVIVTGASSGIGRGIALQLASSGASVVVADIQEEPRGTATPTHKVINERGGEATFKQVDTSQESRVQDLVYEAAMFLDGIDGLVNNAGVHHSAKLHEESTEDWKQLLDINLNGYYYCLKHVLHHFMEENTDGDIVNIGSIAGLVGFGESPAYCASKGAIVELTREAALDYGPHGININAVDPGVIKTQMTAPMLDDETTSSHLTDNTVAPRLGRPSDIANTTAFLLSDKSNFILGENITVDGGWTAH